MNANTQFERDLEQWLQTEAPASAPAGFHASVMDRARTLRQRPGWAASLPIRRLGRGRGMTLLAAAAMLLVGGALAAGSGILRLPSVVPPVPEPSVTAVATASPDATFPSPSESAAPSASPIPVAGPGGAWIVAGTMVTPRYEHAAVRLLDGRVLVAGGSSDREHDLTSAELYDPDTGTWSPTGPMVGGGDTATLLRDGKVLVRGDSGAELYDPSSGTWTATTSKAAQRHSHAAILLPDGNVLVAGGHAPGDEPTDSAELYNPETGSWTTIASMHARREDIDAFLQPDGKVLVMGSSRGDPLSAELYDPTTGAWTALSGSLGLGYRTATLLSDGTVLAIGGQDVCTAAALYDPRTASSTTASSMLRCVNGTSFTLLLDGTVLIAGGRDCNGDGVCVSNGAAELYVPAGVSPPPFSFPPPPPPVFPSPTPRPTPLPPAVGPVPPNARTWKVTVDNRSPELAALFVAEEDGDGALRLVGSATPNVVPAGASVRVTFHFPAKGGPDGWIYVNPRPGDGGSLVSAADIGTAGKILISPEGEVGWLGP